MESKNRKSYLKADIYLCIALILLTVIFLFCIKCNMDYKEKINWTKDILEQNLEKAALMGYITE